MVLPWEHEVRLYTIDIPATDEGEITAACTCGGYSSTWPDGISIAVVWEFAGKHTATHPDEPPIVTVP